MTSRAGREGVRLAILYLSDLIKPIWRQGSIRRFPHADQWIAIIVNIRQNFILDGIFDAPMRKGEAVTRFAHAIGAA